MTSNNMLQAGSSSRKDRSTHTDSRGIIVHKWAAASNSELWNMVDSNLHKEHEGIKVKPHIYYCQRCNKIFILPPWFTTFFMPDTGTNFNALDFIERNIKCCKSPLIFILLREEDLNAVQTEIGMIFIPWLPKEIWIIPETWAHTTIVSEQLLDG